MTTPAEILAAADKHLGAKRTTRATWNFVRRFWASDINLGASAQQICDRVALLEARMAQQHGWAR